MKFPELKRPSVFLASPGDVEQIRSDIVSQFDRRVRNNANREDVDLYAWEEEYPDEDFRRDRPAQTQIPLPSDKNCRAVVAFFGEKIGSPLLQWKDYKREFGDWDGSEKGRLIMPWADKDRKEEEGGFPLTGTVFEVLTAMHRNRQTGHNDLVAELPLEVWFYGDYTIIDKDPMEGNWGCRCLSKKISEISNVETRQKRGDAYKRQLKQLSNFRNFLQHHGCFSEASIVTSVEDARDRFFGFLSRHSILTADRIQPYPFKGLSSYDIADRDVFFGRDPLIKKSVSRFIKAWPERTPGRSEINPGPFFAIKGGSGSGKSSLMRAGMLARLDHHRPTSAMTCVAISAGDMLASPDQPLNYLTKMVLKTLHERADASRRDFTEINTAPRIPKLGVVPNEAVELILDVLIRVNLNRKHGPVHGTRLVLGLDQFELVIDRRQTHPKLLESLFLFIAAACKSGRIGFLYTCETNRVTLLEQDPLLKRISAEIGWPPSLGCDVEAIGPEIITEIAEASFECVQVQLDSPVVEALKTEAQNAHRELECGEDASSLLPLFSLTLERLAEFCRACRNGGGEEETWLRDNSLTDSPKLEPPSTNQPPKSVLSMDEVLRLTANRVPRELLKVGSAIQAQASFAYKEAQDFPGVNEETLSQMLRRLVRIGINAGFENRYELQSTEQPNWGPLRQLMKSFLRCRLLKSSISDPAQVRLVHQAVLTEWELAKRWVMDEKDLSEYAQETGPKIRRWVEGVLDDVSNTALQVRAWLKEHPLPKRIHDETVHHFASLLLGWEDTIQRRDGTQSNRADQILREVGLAVLEQVATDQDVRVDLPQRGSTHFQIAASYGRLELVQKYLNLNRNLAVESRTRKCSNVAISAAHSGDVATLYAVLEAGADPTLTNKLGFQAIHYASLTGSIECVDLLIQRGAHPEARSLDGYTPLMCATTSGYVSLARHLILQYGCDPSLEIDGSWDCVRTACNAGHAEMVELFLAQDGIDPARSGPDDWSAFHMACAVDSPQTVKLLLADSRTRPEQNFKGTITPLAISLVYGSPAVVAELLKSKRISRGSSQNRSAPEIAVGRGPAYLRALLADPYPPSFVSEDFGRALRLAVTRRDLAAVRLLLDERADPNFADFGGTTPILEASRLGYGEVLRLLLEALPPNATIDSLKSDKDGLSALHLAARKGHKMNVSLLLDRPYGRELAGQVTKKGDTALHFAAEGGHTDVADLLLRRSPIERIRFIPAAVNINAQDSVGDAPLHKAAEGDHVKFLEVLLGQGAALELSNKDGKTPLLSALSRGNEDAASLLLQKGARIDSKDGKGWTALHFAVSGCLNKTRGTLLERGKADSSSGLDVNARSNLGEVPLHMAAQSGDEDAIKALLEGGALRELTDNKGRMPLVTAVAAGKPHAFELLAQRAKLHVVDNDGWNVLHHAFAAGLDTVYSRLLPSFNMTATTKDRQTYAHLAARRNDGAALRLLQEVGAAVDDEDDKGRTPLYVALEAGSEEASRALLALDARLEARTVDGATLLHAVCQHNLPELLDELLSSARIDITARAYKRQLTAAHLAAVWQTTAMLERLIGYNAAILDLRDSGARTPLLAAFAAGNETTGSFLLAAGADIQVVDSQGWNILHHAVERNLTDFLRGGVAEHAVDLNARTKDAQTLLHLAVKGNLTEMVQLLLAAEQINPNASDLQGRTPLQLAAFHKQLAIVKMLLDDDRVDVAAQSHTGRTALHYAATVGAVEICRLFRSRMSEASVALRTNGGKTAADLTRENGFEVDW